MLHNSVINRWILKKTFLIVICHRGGDIYYCQLSELVLPLLSIIFVWCVRGVDLEYILALALVPRPWPCLWPWPRSPCPWPWPWKHDWTKLNWTELQLSFRYVQFRLFAVNKASLLIAHYRAVCSCPLWSSIIGSVSATIRKGEKTMIGECWGEGHFAAHEEWPVAMTVWAIDS